MENNEQNKVVEPVSETTNTIMVSEPNNLETPVVEAPVVETPTEEPTQSVTPEPVVIPKGEKPKSNKKKPNPILIILALILLGGACYFEYIYFVKPIINDASATANNTTEGNTKTNTEEKNESSDEIDGEVLVEDETIGKVVAANKKIVSTKDTDGSKDYTYDLYLGNKLLVTNLEYHEDDGYNSDGRIMAKKIGILKDSETDAKYLAFTVYSSPTKYANITFFVVDKDGKVMYKRTSNSNGTYQLSEAPNGYAYDTLYIIDGDTVLFYEENHDDNSLIAKNIKINSGVVNVTVYKTYTSEQLKNESKNQNSNNATVINDEVSIENASIGEKLTIKNIKHTTSDEYTHKYNFDVYLDNKLVVNYEISRYEQIENFLKVVGYMKDNDTGADYMVFTVGPRAETVFVIDGSGKIFYRRDVSVKPESFLIHETGEYVSESTYKIDIDRNASKLGNIYSLLYYVPKSEGDIEMEVKAVQIKSGEATESTYKTYAKASTN